MHTPWPSKEDGPKSVLFSNVNIYASCWLQLCKLVCKEVMKETMDEQQASVLSYFIQTAKVRDVTDVCSLHSPTPSLLRAA